MFIKYTWFIPLSLHTKTHTHKSSSRTIERSGHWWIHGIGNSLTKFFSSHSVVVVVSQFQQRCILLSVQHEKIYLRTALDKHNFLWLFSVSSNLFALYFSWFQSCKGRKREKCLKIGPFQCYKEEKRHTQLFNLNAFQAICIALDFWTLQPCTLLISIDLSNLNFCAKAMFALRML